MKRHFLALTTGIMVLLVALQAGEVSAAKSDWTRNNSQAVGFRSDYRGRIEQACNDGVYVQVIRKSGPGSDKITAKLFKGNQLVSGPTNFTFDGPPVSTSFGVYNSSRFFFLRKTNLSGPLRVELTSGTRAWSGPAIFSSIAGKCTFFPNVPIEKIKLTAVCKDTIKSFNLWKIQSVGSAANLIGFRWKAGTVSGEDYIVKGSTLVFKTRMIVGNTKLKITVGSSSKELANPTSNCS